MTDGACLSTLQYIQRQARNAYEALSVAQQCSAIQDIPVPSRITGELRIARPHGDVQAVQGIIQRFESSDLQTKHTFRDTACKTLCSACLQHAHLVLIHHLNVWANASKQVVATQQNGPTGAICS